MEVEYIFANSNLSNTEAHNLGLAEHYKENLTTFLKEVEQQISVDTFQAGMSLSSLQFAVLRVIQLIGIENVGRQFISDISARLYNLSNTANLVFNMRINALASLLDVVAEISWCTDNNEHQRLHLHLDSAAYELNCVRNVIHIIPDFYSDNPEFNEVYITLKSQLEETATQIYLNLGKYNGNADKLSDTLTRYFKVEVSADQSRVEVLKMKTATEA
jgi:hypothetical protein